MPLIVIPEYILIHLLIETSTNSNLVSDAKLIFDLHINATFEIVLVILLDSLMHPIITWLTQNPTCPG